ncbi:putative transcription factor C2C2-CO-like family [Helianthus debilis subsp. tardiflorus]
MLNYCGVECTGFELQYAHLSISDLKKKFTNSLKICLLFCLNVLCFNQSSGSGSGSGSESGIRDHKSTKSRSNQESDDNSDNSDEDDKLNAKGGSDNGSGTQSSWPKKIVEVDSSQANSLWDNVPNPHDVASAQVARPETSKLDIIEMGKDLEIGVPKSTSFEVEDTNKKMEKFCESNMEKVGDKIDISMQLGCETGASRTEPLNAHKDALKANQLLKNINIEDNYSKDSHALELSLKRPRDVEDADASTQERNVLRHSGLSAFSRYNTVSNVNQTPTGNVDSCSPPPADISSEEAKRNNIVSNSNGTPNQRSNGSDDLGSTTNNAFTTKPDDNPLPVVVHNHHTSAMQALVPCANKDVVVKTTVPQRKAPVQVRHHHHHYHHHHHHVHNKTGDGFSRNMGSNFLTGSTEGNALNYGSGSGSNNKSNGENGAIVEGGMIENGVGNGGPTIFNGGDGSGGSGSGVDQERLTQRKVALNKFLQKRKVRCFKKKVRYQSRKKLAEQRPRVRGQFVKHGTKGVNNEDADS